MPTLAEALAVCKGVSRMDIELKDYGKSQHLEERVVELVEAAGMQNDVVTMSLNRHMVENMKRLRPNWTAGLLAAKAVGEPSRLPFDFLAVESRMATRSFIRAAHAKRFCKYDAGADPTPKFLVPAGAHMCGLAPRATACAARAAP